MLDSHGPSALCVLLARLVVQPGLRDVPNGFYVDRYTVGEDNWTESFK